MTNDDQLRRSPSLPNPTPRQPGADIGLSPPEQFVDTGLRRSPQARLLQIFSAPPRGGPVVKTSTRYSTFYASVVSLRFCSHRCRSLDVTCSRICARPQIFFRLLRCCALTEN